MREFQERNKNKQRMYSKTTIAALVVVLLLVARGVYGVYQKEEESKAEVARVAKEQSELESRYETIQKGSDELKSESGVEAEIRSKFDVIKPGEGVIVVVTKNSSAIEEDKQGVLKRFWDSVMHVFGR